MRKGWESYRKFSEWPYDVALPPLTENERIVVSGIGSVLQALPIQGKIVLTTERLLFLPWRLRLIPSSLFGWQRLEIRLSDIEQISAGSWLRGLWGGFPGFPVFKVALRNGTSYAIQVPFAGWFRKQIIQLMEVQ